LISEKEVKPEATAAAPAPAPAKTPTKRFDNLFFVDEPQSVNVTESKYD
jgi:hypothetical protein